MRPAARLRYPATRTVDVVDDYHGTKVADPYRWLEQLDAQEVRDWAAAQTMIAERVLRENAIRPWIVARVGELQRFWEETSTEARGPALIDDNGLGPGGTIAGTWPSPDGAFAAYAVSELGSEWVETRIRRLSDAADLEERLDGLLWSDASWTKDSRGFFYVRSLKPALGERTAMKGPAVYYHVVGTPQSADIALFRTPQHVTDLVVTQQMSEDGRYLFIYEGNGAHVDGIGWLLTRMYMLDLGDPTRPALGNEIVPLTPARDAAYRVVASAGDTLYVFTDRDAPHRRVVAIDIGNPSPEHWRDVVPETDDVIDQVYDIDGRFVVQYLRSVQHGVRVFDRSGRLLRELSIPPMTAIMDVRRGVGGDELVIEARETFAPTRTRHNVTTGAITVERTAKLPFPSGQYQATQVWYAAKDGVRVPMFLLHRSGLRLDGSHPTILSGYGASSQLTLPWFNEWTVVALELGMVVAIPSLRGGGEFGRTWYEAATLERKQTSFDDFIAAAEYLIREGYTSPEKLAIQGASNGGLLVAVVVNQRPELFRVAVAEVPQSDALRYNRGRHNTQFGDPTNPAHFPFLYAYSPQQHVKRGLCHPSMLITTALNDERSPAWMPMKYTAALQAAQSCDRPIILRADPGGGHGGNMLGDGADGLAFVARQLGLTLPPAAGGPGSKAAQPATQTAGVATQPLIGSGRGIDHVTLLTNDVAAAAKRFADDFGFTIGPIRKLDFGFDAAIIYFSDLTYIELFAISDRDIVGRSCEAFALEAREGVTWVTLDVDSVARVAGFLQKLGTAISARYRVPDNAENWRFQLIEPVQPFLPGGRVYFIEYNDSVRARSRTENKALVERREVHANSAEGLRSVWVAVPDLAAAAAIYASAGMAAGPEFSFSPLSSRAREIRMPGGTILLAQQRPDGQAAARPQEARFTGISVKAGNIDAIRTLLRKQRGLELQPYAGRYGRSVLIPAAVGYGTAIEVFE